MSSSAGPASASGRSSPADPLSSLQSHEGPIRIVEMIDDSRFVLLEDRLAHILGKIPPGVPVSVVSVVGAFRTGKSFLLDLFLRYLRHGAAEARARGEDFAEPPSAAGAGGVKGGARAEWLTFEGPELEGNAAAGAPDYRVAGGRAAGFKWKYGNTRMTTGMWLWSEPFFRKTATGKRVAVLLLDTQGLFDGKTTQLITTQIFGLSTLISSYQIFNIKERIGEDVLQNIAVFAEFARLAAMERDGSATGGDDAQDAPAHANSDAGAVGGDAAPAAETATAPAPRAVRPPAVPRRAPGSNHRGVNREAMLRKLLSHSQKGSHTADAAVPDPVFQRLEFLIRDGQLSSGYDAPEKANPEMCNYVTTVFSELAHDDLRVVRQQILTCFESTSCFFLPHPSLAVTEPSYTGSMENLRTEFLLSLERYVRVVFWDQLEPKSVLGRDLTAPELMSFTSAWAKAFGDARRFPEARVLFNATTEANNRAARDQAEKLYQTALAELTMHSTVHVEADVLAREDAAARAAALALFDEIACFGPAARILDARGELLANIKILSGECAKTNTALAPTSNSLLPLATLSWLILWVLRFFFSACSFFSVCARLDKMAATFQFVAFITIGALLWGAGAETWTRIGVVVNHGLSALGFPQLKISALTAPQKDDVSDAAPPRTHSSGGGGGSVAPLSRVSSSTSAAEVALPSAPASVPTSRAPTPVAGAQTIGSDTIMPSAGTSKKLVDLRFRPVAKNAAK